MTKNSSHRTLIDKNAKIEISVRETGESIEITVRRTHALFGSWQRFMSREEAEAIRDLLVERLA